ncbi:DEAD/DEAH box helicase [Carnobacterium gallinarum]|uniref:DEAD/DEAH box helicase n=1 Tax=Carnobacterium gallinarum TaxID=2749 RepID=UPI00054D8172|nr:DEAD/DEAH box helicase family protein [Carnobacterium gallinarum]
MQKNQLLGRELLKTEFAFECHHDYDSKIQIRKAFFKEGTKTYCNRCGAFKRELRVKAPCLCGDTCFYCLNCLNMGRIRKCSQLYFLPEENNFSPLEEPILKWQGTLSTQQAMASREIIDTIRQKEIRLIWAVAGAGKTEMIFAGIESVLRTGGRVCVASPRVDVCLELAPRLQAAFPKVSSTLLYGDNEEVYRYTQLVIATTHQLLRFKEAFDLLIIDEIDAFPYTVDSTLALAAKKARKKKSSLIYLSATPSKKMQLAIKQHQLLASILPARYHGYPLPQPQSIWFGISPTSKQSKRKLIRHIQILFQKERRILLFMPTIKEMLVFEKELTSYFTEKKIVSVSSEDPKRKEKVLAMRHQKVDLLLTTTILERGVTFIDIDVLVYAAENRLFTTSALVQIAGRAGRHRDFPKGEVLFLHHGKSRSMKLATKQIMQMNILARKRGLLTH